MATKITVPDLPAAAVEAAEKDEMLRELLDGFAMPVKIVKASYATLNKLASQEETIANRVETGEDEASVAYRQAKAEQEQRVASAKAALKAAEEAAEAAISEAFTKAAEGARQDSDVTIEDGAKAIERIKTAAKRVASDVDMLRTYGYGDLMGDWRIPVPAGHGGARGTANRNGEDRQFFPQFATITVDGKDIVASGDIDAPVTNQLVKHLKIQRPTFISALEGAVPGGKEGWQELEAGAEISLNLKIQDKPVRITVTKGSKAAKGSSSDSADDTVTAEVSNDEESERVDA